VVEKYRSLQVSELLTRLDGGAHAGEIQNKPEPFLPKNTHSYLFILLFQYKMTHLCLSRARAEARRKTPQTANYPTGQSVSVNSSELPLAILE